MNDYKQTINGDLDFTSGDIEVVESTYQHQRDLLLSDKGHIRDKPEAGVGAINYMIESDPEEFLRTTRKEFAADGMKVSKLAINPSNELEIEAQYES